MQSSQSWTQTCHEVEDVDRRHFKHADVRACTHKHHMHTHTPTTPEAGRRMWGKAAVSRRLTLDSQIWCNLEFPCYLRKQKKNKSQVGFLLVWAEYCPHASRSFEKSSFLLWKSSPGENPAVSLLWGLSSPNYMCCSNKWPKTCEPFH